MYVNKTFFFSLAHNAFHLYIDDKNQNTYMNKISCDAKLKLQDYGLGCLGVG